MAHRPAEAVAADAARTSSDVPVVQRRYSLTKFDTVACKVFEPCGVNALDGIPLDRLWNIVADGDKHCAFLSELSGDSTNCLSPQRRVAVGVSRYAEGMLNVMKEWKGNVQLRSLLQSEVVAEVDVEVARLERHMERLNFGSPTRPFSAEDPFADFKEAKRRRLDGDPTSSRRATEPELQVSIEVLFTFLEKRASPLEML